jgi:hypothetical protein
VVVTLTVAKTGVTPPTLTDDGDIEHVELAGAPEHVSAIVPLKPVPPTRDIGYVAVAPAVTVAEPPEPLLPPDTLKSAPVPRSAIIGEIAEMTVNVPVRLPPAVGVKVTDI